MNTITWKIGGEAGFGIMTTGLMFSKLAIRHGWHIFDYVEYPSLIRGGHNVYEVCMGEEEVFSQEKQVDLLFALNQQTIDLHLEEMKIGGLIAYDHQLCKLDKSKVRNKSVIVYPIPFVRLTKEAGAKKVMENNVVLGASAALLSMDLEILNQLISDTFGKKGEEMIKENQAAAKVGYDYVTRNFPSEFNVNIPSKKAGQRMVVSGNDAVGMGAIAAGCKFYVAYPMTPSSSLLHFMAHYGSRFGLVVKHAEDEISVINMAIGAGYAGVRAMIGTSGGGFSLMTEGLGLAAVTETPLVIFESQRPGPATGMPTWTAQADLQFIIHAAQDEFPRIIMAPGDMEEAFYLTFKAFNLAERYQVPVFILSDKYLAESHRSVPFFDQSKLQIDRGKLMSWQEGDNLTGKYLRYQLTDDGVSKRALPGMKKAVFSANSYEHTEYGFSTEDSKERIDQVNKRMRKLEAFVKDMPEPKVYGDNKAEISLVCWGSTKGPILEAMRRLKWTGYTKTINCLHLNHLWPFPTEFVRQFLQKARYLLLLEGNSQAQLGSLIREQTGIEIKAKYLRYDGRPFYPDDIMAKIKEI